MKYRVTEINGFFIIEVQATVTKGMLWWKRTKWEWFETNMFGGKYHPPELSNGMHAPLCDPFTSRLAAHNQMCQWEFSNTVESNVQRSAMFSPSNK